MTSRHFHKPVSYSNFKTSLTSHSVEITLITLDKKKTNFSKLYIYNIYTFTFYSFVTYFSMKKHQAA